VENYISSTISYSGNTFDSFPNGIATIPGTYDIPTDRFVQRVAFVGVLEDIFI
jgi:hypothetical protein